MTIDGLVKEAVAASASPARRNRRAMLAPAGSLVHRYLILSLLFSVVPIIAIGAAYHAFVSDIISQTTIRQLENDLQIARNNVRSVLNSFDQRLQSLADLPELRWIEPITADDGLPATLQTIFDFELDNPDLYAIGLIDAQDREILVTPQSAMSELGLTREGLPAIEWQNATLIGPSIGPPGRPGWVGLQRQIRSDTNNIRAMVLWIRLAALTEASKSLDRLNLSQAMISTPGGRFDVVGSKMTGQPDVLMTSEIAPFWQLEVVLTGTPAESLGNFRWVLLVAVLISGLAIAIVFRQLSNKLDSHIAPLVEGAGQISRGDLSVRVSETSGGEIGALARAFNQMGDSLRQTVRSNVEIERRALLGEISAGIAHEVLNPMTSIRTSVQGLAREPGPAPDDVRAISEMVLEEVDRVSDLMSNFLAFARPREPSPERIDLAATTGRALGLILSAASEAQVQVHNCVPQALYARIDPVHYRQIVMNLVLNAIDACDPGAMIEITAREVQASDTDEGHVEVTVSDGGRGMSAQVAENAIKPFFTTKYGGTGLGLAISAELARSNGGHLAIARSGPQGTSIVFSLPACMPACMPASRQAPVVDGRTGNAADTIAGD